jgi:hypothetical protein
MAFSSLALLSLAACSGAEAPSIDDENSEEALGAAGMKVLVRNVEHPGGLAVTDKHLYFSQNHFVASGDPELDQQMAYWEGKYARVPLTGGAREKLTDAGIVRVRLSGKTLYGATGDSCWITSFDTSATQPQAKPAFDDPDCNEYGPVGFEATSDKLAVVTAEGDLMVGKGDGSASKKVGTFYKSGYVIPFLNGETLANGNMVVLTARDPEQKRKQAIVSMSLAGGAPKTIVDFPIASSEAQNLTTDGTNLFFSQDAKVFVVKSGDTKATLVSDGFASVSDLLSDGTNLVVNDGKRGAIYEIKSPLQAPKQVKVLSVKHVEALTLGGGKVYFGTHVVTKGKATGVIASIKLP